MSDTALSLDQYDALIYALYQGISEETPWQSFLPLLRDLLDARVVSLVLRPPAAGDKGVILNCLRPEEGDSQDVRMQLLADPNDWQSQAYQEQFFALDPFINLAEGQITSLAELMPGDALVKSEFYQQYLKPIGVHHILAADTTAADGSLARLRVSRGAEENSFGEREKQLCQRVIPHLRQAIFLHASRNRIESERELFAGAMDKLSVGTILLDQNLQFLHGNQLANDLLEQKDGISVIERKLHLHQQDESQQLYQLLQEIKESQLQHQTGIVKAFRIRRPSGRPDLALVIRPVPASEWSEGQNNPAIALFLSDPEQQFSTSQQTLVELFNFTKAEAALALLLTRGLTLAEASSQLNISQHTARAQLKAIFAKSGVTRQAELIRLIVKSVADLA